MKAVIVGVVLAVGSATALAGPVAVTVKPATTKLQIGTPVDVTLTVTNQSKSVITFTSMSCSWGDDWQATDADLSWAPWACDKNVPHTIRLLPAESHAWTLAITPSATAKLGAHTLGFKFHPSELTAVTGSTTVTVTK